MTAVQAAPTAVATRDRERGVIIADVDAGVTSVTMRDDPSAAALNARLALLQFMGRARGEFAQLFVGHASYVILLLSLSVHARTTMSAAAHHQDHCQGADEQQRQ
jgi:hypothetical protein